MNKKIKTFYSTVLSRKIRSVRHSKHMKKSFICINMKYEYFLLYRCSR